MVTISSYVHDIYDKFDPRVAQISKGQVAGAGRTKQHITGSGAKRAETWWGCEKR